MSDSTSNTSKNTSKVVLITGGSKKLGFAVAKKFVDEGYQVLLMARGEESLKHACEQLGAQASYFAGDILSAESRASAFKQAQSMGELSVLVNCAGYFVWKGLDKLEENDWDLTLDIQLKAPFLMIQEAGRTMSSGSAIVNIGSIHGEVGDKNVIPQCAAKAGLVGLTKACAEALRDQGIRVNAVLPGAIAGDSAERPSEGLGEMISQADVANTAYFLGSGASSGLTGSAISAYGITRPVIASP